MIKTNDMRYIIILSLKFGCLKAHSSIGFETHLSRLMSAFT